MMPRQILVTTAALTVFAGAVGFWMGLRWQPLDETQMISGVVARYVTDHEGAPTDCVAVPGSGAVWIAVSCGPVQYSIDVRGRVTQQMRPET